MKYYFILATKEFLFEIEPVEEVLRERAHYYSSRNKQVDFWILPSPEFLNAYANELKELTKNNSNEKAICVPFQKDIRYIFQNFEEDLEFLKKILNFCKRFLELIQHHLLLLLFYSCFC